MAGGGGGTGGGTDLPAGTIGQMLYHNGTEWVVLPNPGAPAHPNWQLRHGGSFPYWARPIDEPVHPWKIIINNARDALGNFVSASAQVHPNSILYTSFRNYTSTFAVSGLSTVWTPANGMYLYLAGTLTSGLALTSLTLTSTMSLPSRMVHSGTTQTQYNVVIGKFIQLADGSFIAEQWANSNLTHVALCVDGFGAVYPMSAA